MYNRRILQNLIRESVHETLFIESQRAHIKGLVAEELRRALNEEEDDNAVKRRIVMDALKDPKFNHAQLAYELGHPKDQSEKDTLRSEFSKKATGKPDNDGVVRKFSDEDINKLYQMIRKR